MIRQIREVLKDATWPDGNTEKVFGAVIATQGIEGDRVPQLRFPFVLVGIGSSSADDDEPEDLETLDVTVKIVQRVQADQHGETALIGGARSGGQGSSAGRGVLELAEQVRSELGILQRKNGVRLQLISRNSAQAVSTEGLYYITQALTFEAWITSDRTYEAATRFTATDATGGDASLAWTLPPDRFDRVGVVLRRASGSTPPSSATAGTGVTLASATATSVTDSPGAGTFSYALFGSYDELGSYAGSPYSPDRYSASVTATVTVT